MKRRGKNFLRYKLYENAKMEKKVVHSERALRWLASDRVLEYPKKRVFSRRIRILPHTTPANENCGQGTQNNEKKKNSNFDTIFNGFSVFEFKFWEYGKFGNLSTFPLVYHTNQLKFGCRRRRTQKNALPIKKAFSFSWREWSKKKYVILSVRSSSSSA